MQSLLPQYHENRVKITDANVIICSPGRNFVTLKILVCGSGLACIPA